MAELVVRLTKVSGDQHRFDYVRPDGTGEGLTLATRSFLLHDLLHFAVETEAGLRQSFYGLLAGAGSYAGLAEATAESSGEVGVTEMVVGAFTGLAKGEVAAEAAVAGAIGWMEALGRAPPPWLTTAFACGVAERFRRLMGEWRATPFGGTMTLRFPL
jgi:hypothetical protein